jgi:hypothetical protein
MDFRGYLNTLGQNGDQKAGAYLGYVGNDYKLGGATGVNYAQYNKDSQLAPSMFYGQSAQQAVGNLDNYYNQYQKSLNNSPPTGPAGPSAAEKAEYAGFTNKAYDTKIAGLQSVYDTLNPQEDNARLNVNNQYQNQTNALSSQKAIGERNLNMAGEQVEAGKVKSLADLGHQVQTMGMSYNNQLGNYGAGDSSAAGLIQQALSGMASKNRANVVGSASQQQTQIGLQRQDLQTNFDNNWKSLDDWKSSSLNDIATKFMQQRQQIQQQMAGANADRAQALAQIDRSYVNMAMQALGNLETQYRSAASELVGKYQSMAAPNAAISDNLQQFAVKPIEAGKIASMTASPGYSQGNQPTAAAFRRPFEQDYGYGLGY